MNIFTTGLVTMNSALYFPALNCSGIDNFERMAGVATSYRAFSRKYCRLRRRFLSKFYYKGFCASHIRRVPEGHAVVFSDQTVYMGIALMIFAGESKILKDFNIDPSASDALILEMLSTFDTLNAPASLAVGYLAYDEGFFIRDWVARADSVKLGLRRSWSVESDFQKAVDAHEPGQAAATLDQVVSLMAGWWAVAAWSESSVACKLASIQSNRILQWLQRNQYLLYQPNGSPAPRGGDNAWAAGGHIKRIVEMINSKSIGGQIIGGHPVIAIPATKIPGFADIPTNEYWKPLRDVLITEKNVVQDLFGIASIDKIPSLSDEELNETSCYIINHRGALLDFAQSYVRHLTLTVTAFDPHIATDAFNDYAVKSRHYLAILLRRVTKSYRAAWRPPFHLPLPGQIAIDTTDYAALENAFEEREDSLWSDQSAWKVSLLKAYSSCPNDGPNAADSGDWCKDSRWIRSTDLTASADEIASKEEYNGLDFLSLEVLMRLAGIL